jgi:SAM-dependent methyltransferase
MASFPDHFSGIAAAYARHRPHYPAALFDWLAASAPDRDRAWDCGTGNGQAAKALAERFGEVVATDPSVAQLANAARTENLAYVAMTAEQVALGDRTIGLVTVAQALHWFERAPFYREVDRVLRPGGILAAWSYALATIDPEIDAILSQFYGQTLASYWPTERAVVDAGYAGIDFPYPEFSHPRFEMETEWSLAQLGGYLSTWSAVRRYRTQLGADPLPAIMYTLATVWGRPSMMRRVRWPLTLRVGRRHD